MAEESEISTILGVETRDFYDYLLKAGVTQSAIDGWIHSFCEIEYYHERVDMVTKHQQHLEWFRHFETTRKKDSYARTQFHKGSSFFKKEQYLEAMECFTKSVAYADKQHRLAYAYERRALCLEKLKYYTAMNVDLERACDNNHIHKSALLQRMSEPLVNNDERTYKYHEDIPTVPEHLSDMKGFEIFKEDNGTCARATQQIEVGEVVMVQSPSACILRSEAYSHCDNCFEICYNLIPCESCPYVLYCNEQCRTEAFEQYHNYECVILPSLEAYGLSRRRRLGLRYALAKRKDKGDDHKISMTVNRSIFEVLDLEECYRITAGIAYICKLLKDRTDFFDSGTPTETFFKGWLTRCISTVELAAVSILELNPAEHKGQSRMVGWGFYPTIDCQFTHSCAPNLYRTNYGKLVALTAIKPIQINEKGAVTYGPTYVNTPKSSRQGYFQRVHYRDCECMACKNDWPQLSCKLQTAIDKKLLTLYHSVAQKQDPTTAAEGIRELRTKKFDRHMNTELRAFLYNFAITCQVVLGNKAPN